MNPAIDDNRGALAALCRRFHVVRFEVFGSAVTDDFEPARSDLDFLVEFDPAAEDSIVDDYFDLLFALEKFFARRVDSVMARAMRNPYFIKSVNQQRQVLYAA